MAEYMPDIESLKSEELLSIVLSMVAPTESDPLHEHGLRFEAQRAATELYCRAASLQRGDRAACTVAETGDNVWQLHGR